MQAKNSNKIFAVATFATAFFILILTFFAPAYGASKPAAAGLEKARLLVVDGKRSDALRTIADVWKQFREGPDSKSTKARTEIMTAWEEIATVFLSDKGQNQFSLAESFWLTKPKEAAELLTGVQSLEDGNVTVSLLGGRAALRSQDCVRAETFTKEAERSFPVSPEVKLLRLQVQSCQVGNQTSAPALKIPTLSGASALTSEPPIEWGPLDSAIRLLVVKDHWRRKDAKSARAAVTAWETQAPDDPEVWFWKWKTSDSVGGRGASAVGSGEIGRDRSAARKYLRICSEMTARKRKNFAMHPELCLETETVESDLKSSDKSGS